MGQLDDEILYTIAGVVISTSFTNYEVEVEESEALESFKSGAVSSNSFRAVSVCKRDLLKQRYKLVNSCGYFITWEPLLDNDSNKEVGLKQSNKVFWMDESLIESGLIKHIKKVTKRYSW